MQSVFHRTNECPKATWLETYEDIAAYFPGGEADEFNWLFLSTSGVHGSYLTLDDLERDAEKYASDDETISITVLIVHPRKVHMAYGDVVLDDPAKQIPALRRLVDTTLVAVRKSQEGNIPPACVCE